MEYEPVGLRVLIVEDEYFIAREIADALQHGGAMVVGPAGNLEKALHIIGKTDVDVAVLDINLGGKVDFALADELAARRVPFVFATGYDAGIIPARFKDIPRFEKPYDTAGLIDHLRRMSLAVGGEA